MWYVIALIVVVLVIFIWLIQRPLYHRKVRQGEFEKFFRVLLTECADGSLLFIQHEGSQRFVQFVKYSLNQEHSLLHFGFPDAPWSRQYFDSLTETFQKLGFDIKITTGEGLIRRFLEIDLEEADLENKVSKGVQIARVAFETMGLTKAETFKANFQAKLSTEAARPALETLRGHPSKLVRRLSLKFLTRLEDAKDKAKKH
jgi:hypothetical protein